VNETLLLYQFCADFLRILGVTRCHLAASRRVTLESSEAREPDGRATQSLSKTSELAEWFSRSACSYLLTQCCQ
jgi:hypothetical protein